MSDYIDCVNLARVSSKGQEDEGYSLDSQVKTLDTYTTSRGLRLRATYKITESASKSVQRKIFKDMMKFIEDNNIKHLVVEKVDRHVRNLHDAVETYDWLMHDEERRIHFVKDSLVMHKNSRSQEWLNWGIRVVMSKNYIDNLREEAMKGWAEKLAQGWLPASPPPGYITEPVNGKKIHLPNPDTYKMMLASFKHYHKPGGTLDSTTVFMDKVGLRSRNGKPFSKSYVQSILTNPFYIGINRFNGRDYPGAQETFIPKKLFMEVQAKMHRGRPRVYGKHHSPLQGLIRCEDCNSIVTWQLQKGTYYGVCRRLTEACKQGKMLREDKVEELIMYELERLVCPSQEVIGWVSNAMRERYKERIEEREHVVNSLQTKIDRVGQMDETLYDDKLSGEITKERYEEKHEAFAKQKAELQEQLDGIDVTLGERLEQRLVILELSQKAASIYAKKSPEQKRLIISKLFSQLTLKGGSLSVKYSKFTEAVAERVQKTANLMEKQI